MGQIILFGSVTWALRAQKLLELQGIRSAVKKVANNPKLGGCGYGLEVGRLQEALHILQANHIRMIDIL